MAAPPAPPHPATTATPLPRPHLRRNWPAAPTAPLLLPTCSHAVAVTIGSACIPPASPPQMPARWPHVPQPLPMNRLSRCCCHSLHHTAGPPVPRCSCQRAAHAVRPCSCQPVCCHDQPAQPRALSRTARVGRPSAAAPAWVQGPPRRPGPSPGSAARSRPAAGGTPLPHCQPRAHRPGYPHPTRHPAAAATPRGLPRRPPAIAATLRSHAPRRPSGAPRTAGVRAAAACGGRPEAAPTCTAPPAPHVAPPPGRAPAPTDQVAAMRLGQSPTCAWPGVRRRESPGPRRPAPRRRNRLPMAPAAVEWRATTQGQRAGSLRCMGRGLQLHNVSQAGFSVALNAAIGCIPRRS